MSPNPRPEQRADSGFTLIEALVALGVLAMVLAAISSLSAGNKLAIGSTIERAQTALFARNIMNELSDRGTDAVSRSGQVGGFRWTYAARPFGVDPNEMSRYVWIPYRVAIDVRGPGGARETIDTIQLRKAAR